MARQRRPAWWPTTARWRFAPDRWAARSPATTSRSSTTTANRSSPARWATSSCAANRSVPSGCSPATTTTRALRPRRSAGRSTTPATRRRWTRTATSGSRAATTTSSPPAPTASDRSKSKACSSSIRPSIEAAVVGKDDPERTQIVTAFCILAPGHTGSAELADELQDFVKHAHRPLQIPPRDPLRRRTAQDHQRQDPALGTTQPTRRRTARRLTPLAATTHCQAAVAPRLRNGDAPPALAADTRMVAGGHPASSVCRCATILSIGTE